MDTRSSSRRRPFQPLVDLSELQSERLPLLEITFGELHQIVQPLTLMVAAHRLVQRPPHQFHRVALGRPRRKRMQTDATPGVLHVFLHPLARVACVVVRRQVQLLVAAVGSAQLLEQPYEQFVVPALPGHPVQTPCVEVQSPADPHFAVGPRGAKRLLFPCAHPAEAHLGVGLQLGLVLEKEHASSRVIRRMSSSLAHFCSMCSSESLSGPTGRGLLQRKPSRWSARRTVCRLTRLAARSPNSWRAMSLQLQRSWRAQPAVVGGRILLDRMLEALVRSFSEQRLRASPLAVVEGHPSLTTKASYDRVEGGARTEEHAGDLGGRAILRSEQDDVHPQSAAGFRFALQFGDEALAYLWGDGDILHVRPSLLWLDGCGVFTMPQRAAVCSIILCIYLEDPCLEDPSKVF